MSINNYYKSLTIVRNTKVEWDNDTTVSTSGLGYIQPLSGSEIFQDSKNSERVSHRLYTPATTDIIYLDTITQDSVSYKAVYTDQVGGVVNRGHHKEILLERLV